MLGPFATTSHLTPIQQMSLVVLSRAACASMSTTTSTTTTTTRDRGDRYGPMEWAQQGTTWQNNMLPTVGILDRRCSHLVNASKVCCERVIIVSVLATSTGCTSKWWVLLPAWSFLLVFYGNNCPHMHQFWDEAWNRQTDKWTAALLNASYHKAGVGHKNKKNNKDAIKEILCNVFFPVQTG